MNKLQNVRREIQNVGRPSTSKALKRQEELLDRALDLFLENGFERTTMDSIAASVGMTKRTIYSRYEDKSAFFRATVMQAIERIITSQAKRLLQLETGSLEDTLVAVARMRIHQVMTPEGMRLQRIINAEAYRFPEIFRMAQRHIAMPVVDFLADVLERYAAAGILHVTRPQMTAAAFMNMVAGAAVRQIGLGGQMEESEIEDRIEFSVALFLDGVRAHGPDLAGERIAT